MASDFNAQQFGTHFDKELLACLQHAAELKAKNKAGERNLSELEMARNDITRLLGLIQNQQRAESRGNIFCLLLHSLFLQHSALSNPYFRNFQLWG